MIAAILQARTSSTRLPGKVLEPILGRPMLEREIERIRRARTLDRLVIATSVDASDDPIAAYCETSGIECFRGSLSDVLDRYYHAANAMAADTVVRLTADCPLIDPAVIDQTVEMFTAGRFDYVSNALKPTYPDGFDTEVFSVQALAAAWRDAKLPSEREHVTPFLYHHPESFRIGTVSSDRDLSHLRWTVDEPRDLEFVRAVYDQLWPAKPAFTTDDVLRLLAAKPELAKINLGIPRNEGYQKSLAEDRKKGKQ